MPLRSDHVLLNSAFAFSLGSARGSSTCSIYICQWRGSHACTRCSIIYIANTLLNNFLLLSLIIFMFASILSPPFFCYNMCINVTFAQRGNNVDMFVASFTAVQRNVLTVSSTGPTLATALKWLLLTQHTTTSVLRYANQRPLDRKDVCPNTIFTLETLSVGQYS